MAIASKPKTRAHHKKRQARHHKQSKTYMKPYWPYLPMLAIVGAGAYANSRWLTPENSNLSLALYGQPPTRIETMIGSQNQIALVIIIAMATAAAAIFIARHWFRIHRLLNRGERFIIKHPWLDILLVAVCTLGVLLTRPG